MKVSLINPTLNSEISLKDKKKMVSAAPPLGLIYIATVLKNDGIDVSILDQAAEDFSLDNTVKWVKKEDPDILGFSTLTFSGRTAASIAGEVKRENPNTTIVFGNYHATFNFERILDKYPFVDIIVRGEGEYISLELVRCLEKEGNLKKVLGITFRKRGRIFSTQDRPLNKDVDSLPFPDRDLIKIEYHNTTAGVNVAPKKFTTFVSSRGCVYRCRFCGCQKLAQSLWRPRSIENILEELHLLVSQGYKQVMFVDDNFTLDQKRVIRLCERMKKENVDIEWICEGRVDQSSFNMFREMVKANCKMMYFGIESANRRILDYYNKKTTPEQAEVAVRNAKKAGIDVVVGSFILGATNEKQEEIQNTLEFAKHLQIDIPQFNILAAFPGTEIWEELKMKGYVNEDKFWETGIHVPEVSPETVSYKKIESMIHKSYTSFFLRPNYILSQGIRLLRSPYRFNVLINNLKRIDKVLDGIHYVT